ncbi:hypothetical protein HJG60_008327 [Phyllostomus discolor]|uniref:Uncharacterized protein n=1 Tax=Phyllostomus discolor TaxID=89673 RepID=A0A834DQK2_9CHIR|nr:hypothetical protein HJG60_008327 [Phyllostomus discolor]
MCRHREREREVAVCKPSGEAHQELNLRHPDLELPAPRTGRNGIILSKNAPTYPEVQRIIRGSERFGPHSPPNPLPRQRRGASCGRCLLGSILTCHHPGRGPRAALRWAEVETQRPDSCPSLKRAPAPERCPQAPCCFFTRPCSCRTPWFGASPGPRHVVLLQRLLPHSQGSEAVFPTRLERHGTSWLFRDQDRPLRVSDEENTPWSSKLSEFACLAETRLRATRTPHAEVASSCWGLKLGHPALPAPRLPSTAPPRHTAPLSTVPPNRRRRLGKGTPS